MNNVLVTGLGIANDLGLCESCNLDFTWLAINPSVLLWSDKIILPLSGYKAITNRTEDKCDRVINMFLEMADKANMIRIVDFSDIYEESVRLSIEKSARIAKNHLITTYPGRIFDGDKHVPNEIIIENESYCGPYIESVFASMKIAEDYDANCLFSNREHNLLKYLYGANTSKELTGASTNQAYNEIFSLYMPESMQIHSYAFTNPEKCFVCINEKQCKDTYLKETQTAFNKILKWREYDEIEQAKAEIDKILRIKNSITSQGDIKDVVKQFQERQTSINKNITNRFPKIERWTKMTTVIGTTITLASLISGNMPLAITSSIVTSASEISKESLDIYKSKNNWAGFINEMKSS